jgi:putative membrane protein
MHKVAVLFFAFALVGSSKPKCDCAHFPWKPRECIRICERGFVVEEIRRNNEAMVLGGLAVQRASDTDVKSFGQRVIDERSTIKERFKSLAADLKLGELSDSEAGQRRLLNRFKNYRGADFDRNYMNFETKESEDEVGRLQRVTRDDDVGKDIRAVAAEALPWVKSQLESASSLSSKLQ